LGAEIQETHTTILQSTPKVPFHRENVSMNLSNTILQDGGIEEERGEETDTEIAELPHHSICIDSDYADSDQSDKCAASGIPKWVPSPPYPSFHEINPSKTLAVF
jgi:hypothetical protein